MNIYLDIDGVLLTKSGNQANFIKEFLEYVVKNHHVYWLTTHCKGDAFLQLGLWKDFLMKKQLN